MRRLILRMSVSVDGFAAGPSGEGDWMIRSRSEEGKASIAGGLWQAGLLVMGSRSYLGMMGFWPTSTDLLAEPMNAIPKVVFTRQRSLDLTVGASPETLALPDAASWAKPQIASGDLATEIERLKQQPGKEIVALGGVGFARSLASLGLIDEYRLAVHPVALGNGLSLFSDLPKPLDLKLVSTSIFASGVAGHVYRPA